jgi:hypothetical protein
MEASMSSQREKTNEAMYEVARIARVPEANQTAFVRILGSAIKRAHSESSRPGGKNISASALTRDFLTPSFGHPKNFALHWSGCKVSTARSKRLQDRWRHLIFSARLC